MKVRRDAHQRDRQHQPDDEDPDRRLMRDAGHREHVVERHRHIGDDDLQHRLAGRLAVRRGRIGGVAAGAIDFGPEQGAAAAAALSAGTMCPARISRYIFHDTHSSRMPPASVRPMISSRCIVTPANRMRSTVAAAMPARMTRWRCRAGSPAAAIPTTIALSPASTISIMTTDISALSSVISSSTPAT